MRTYNLKFLAQYRRTMLLAGRYRKDEKMSKIVEMCEEAMEGVLDGSTPITTGETAHKIAHSAAQNKFADRDLQDRMPGSDTALEKLLAFRD